MGRRRRRPNLSEVVRQDIPRCGCAGRRRGTSCSHGVDGCQLFVSGATRVHAHRPALESLTLTTAPWGVVVQPYESRCVTMALPAPISAEFPRPIALFRVGTTCRIFGFSAQRVECVAVPGGGSDGGW